MLRKKLGPRNTCPINFPFLLKIYQATYAPYFPHLYRNQATLPTCSNEFLGVQVCTWLSWRIPRRFGVRCFYYGKPLVTWDMVIYGIYLCKYGIYQWDTTYLFSQKSYYFKLRYQIYGLPVGLPHYTIVGTSMNPSYFGSRRAPGFWPTAK